MSGLIDMVVPRRMGAISLRLQDDKTWADITPPSDRVAWWWLGSNALLILPSEKVARALSDNISKYSWWAASVTGTPVTVRLYTPSAMGVFMANKQDTIFRRAWSKMHKAPPSLEDARRFVDLCPDGAFGWLDDKPAPLMSGAAWADYLSLRMSGR